MWDAKNNLNFKEESVFKNYSIQISNTKDLVL